MIKKSIYPKTQRVSCNSLCQITEKIDGSNLCIFKLEGKIYIAQRNNIISEDELNEISYKGLQAWIEEHLDYFKENLYENACICGEWLGMGKIHYDFPNRFFMFAKANVNEKMELYNIKYYHEFFKYSFIDQQIPEFISEVPVVLETPTPLTVEALDTLYTQYCLKENRIVEGFVHNFMNSITKYVRMKDGHLQDHRE